ncbi:short-chain dehydrogenase [Talaromyces proteolyticus]|uniref:Short-chain dehydrogenase n=1 Tax=Talaromyces proteolyticus TaxID=1131652 RepID=A0AAD4PVT2_9EURO|nr:short-chain dehydrogenase [Talaromyces proteolyticus]KAH8691147.1 short-chain dehydrogenase [Talaromyces proteolyticus]
MNMAFSAQSTGEEVSQILSGQIKGSNALITGVTPGSIGFTAALHISQHKPNLLILAGRNISSLKTAQDTILSTTAHAPTIKLLVLDLSSQESIRQAAAEVNSYPDPITHLVNSAGVMASPYATTADGIELQFGTNHIGHFLFTNLVLPRVLSSAGTLRVVNVSSAGHKRGPVRFDDIGFNNGQDYDKWAAYGQSKTANMLFSVSLAQKLSDKGVEAFSLYPGRILTGIARHLKDEEMMKAGWMREDGSLIQDPKLNWRSLSQTAATLIVATYDGSISGRNGSYMVNNVVSNGDAEEYALDPVNAERLWMLSEELVGQKFTY